MVKEIKVKDVIDALRCSSSSKANCKHEECHYWKKCDEDEEEIRAFREDNPDLKLPENFFASCDCDQICIDAANMLEKLDSRFKHVRLSNGNTALFDTQKRRVYHSYMSESFMEKTGLSYKVVESE